MLYDKHNNVVFKNKFKGKSIFSLMTGPSLTAAMADQLTDKYTFSIKFLPLTFHPTTIWCCLENSKLIPWQVWEQDQTIKIVSDALLDNGYIKPIDPLAEKSHSRVEVIKRLNHIYYVKLSESYKADTYFSGESVAWGMARNKTDEHGFKGRRSIMLAHFKILYWLGFRKIYLCGVDFQMREEQPYCYERYKNPIAVSENNILYQCLTQRLTALKVMFDICGLQVFNCNPESHLKVFPQIDFQDALNDSASRI